MNRGKLIEQLIFWHENNEHEQIISSIEKIPRNEWDFELSGLYARALNNLDHYQEALDLLMAFEHEGREDGVWNFRVGYSLYYLNREAEAAEYFQKAIDFGDDGEDTQEMLKRSIAEDLEKKWFNFTGNFNKKLIENGGDWDALSEKEQELAALWKLEADMYNGGFIQFFCNWGYTCYMHAVRGLTRLKAEQPLGIIQEQYNIIERLKNDERLKAYWDIPKYLTDEEYARINNELDPKYWKNSDTILKKTFQVYADFL